CASPLNYW
nr:immunoglobulin heavy chain junction region [Mus musculus]